jgi:hypothetical protein
LSDGEKKPGLRDIGDLKNRLGMLNKRVSGKPTAPGTNPFAPKAPAAPAAPAETAPPAADAASADAPQAPAATPAAAPAAPQAFSKDLFSGPATVNESPPSTPASQSELADMFESSAAVLDAPPPVEQNFANPLQMGAYNEGVASIDLSADEEASLNSYEGSQRGMKPRMAISLIATTGAVALFFGFMLGDVRTSRKMINAQVDASKNLKDRMKPVLATLDQLKDVIPTMSDKAVSWKNVEKLPKDLPAIDGGLILNTPVPYERELARALTSMVTQLNLLFEEVRVHRSATNIRDKAELKALETGSDFGQYPVYAMVYESLPPRFKVVKEVAKGWQPPFGKLYGVAGKPKMSGSKDDYIMDLAGRDGSTTSTSLSKILLLNKDELQTASKTNALTLYSQRVKSLKVRFQKVLDQEQGFREKMKAQADREKVFSF